MNEPMAFARVIWHNWFFTLWHTTTYFPNERKERHFWLQTPDEYEHHRRWFRNLRWRTYEIPEDE